ncbi:hypothetical protein ACHAW6_007466 [Cyclotella cf. meneghiniana]
MRILPTILALVLTSALSHAASCQGNAGNSCNGLVNTCTSDGGLCVVDSTTGTCCTLPSSYAAISRSSETTDCASDMDGSVCADSELVTTAAPSATDDESGAASGEECFDVEIGIILDDKPDEIAWEITEGRKSTLQQPSATVVSNSPYYDPYKYRQASDTFVVCLAKGKYTFTVIDRGNDGICCSAGEGKYALSYRPTGDLIAQGGRFASSESTTFKIPYSAPPPSGDNRTHDGQSTTTNEDCSNEFGLHLVTDDYGVETTWELREKGDSVSDNSTDWTIAASGGPYASDFTYDISYCVRPGRYEFVFYDWQCDGLRGVRTNGYYTLVVNGMEVHTGGTNMTGYDEVVELNFMNEPAGNDGSASGYDASSLSKYKKSAGGAGGKVMDCSRWMGGVLVAVAVAAMAFY